MIVTPFGIVMLVMLEHPSNAAIPMLVTLSGIVMLVSDEQFRNVASSMLVTLFGIVMLVSDEQFSYLQPVITQYFASNKSEIWS